MIQGRSDYVTILASAPPNIFFLPNSKRLEPKWKKYRPLLSDFFLPHQKFDSSYSPEYDIEKQECYIYRVNMSLTDYSL